MHLNVNKTSMVNTNDDENTLVINIKTSLKFVKNIYILQFNIKHHLFYFIVLMLSYFFYRYESIIGLNERALYCGRAIDKDQH